MWWHIRIDHCLLLSLRAKIKRNDETCYTEWWTMNLKQTQALHFAKFNHFQGTEKTYQVGAFQRWKSRGQCKLRFFKKVVWIEEARKVQSLKCLLIFLLSIRLLIMHGLGQAIRYITQKTYTVDKYKTKYWNSFHSPL